MSESVNKVIEQFGQMVTGQINIAWDTRQTAEQFLEIREQGGLDGDSAEFTIEEFVEYVRSNTSDVINQTIESFGQIELEKEIFVLDSDGTDVDA
jgi:hypothetical protein